MILDPVSLKKKKNSVSRFKIRTAFALQNELAVFLKKPFFLC